MLTSQTNEKCLIKIVAGKILRCQHTIVRSHIESHKIDHNFCQLAGQVRCIISLIRAGAISKHSRQFMHYRGETRAHVGIWMPSYLQNLLEMMVLDPS